MNHTPGTCSEESLRILAAAKEGRLSVNEHGRYVIAGEPRPARKDRENLQRWGFIDWRWRDGSRWMQPCITDAGISLLYHAKRERMAATATDEKQQASVYDVESAARLLEAQGLPEAANALRAAAKDKSCP